MLMIFFVSKSKRQQHVINVYLL